MAIHISGWTICLSDELIARQYDNLRRIEVAGDIPEGYSWDLLLCYGNLYDAIPLQADSDGLSATLTAAQCSESGPYYIQLRGASADGAVRHTNTISAIVPPSLSGTASWPTIPSEFEALEARIRDIASHPPIPGEDGKWQIWDPDAGKYVPSDFPLPEGSGGETWEEVSTIPLVAGTAVYNLGSLTTYRRLRIAGSVKLVATAPGGNWLSINGSTGQSMAQVFVPSGWLIYTNRWIDVARDNLWVEWIGIANNNLSTPQAPTMLRHRVTWPEGETQVVLSLATETAAAIADGAEITIYGVRA